MNSEQLLGLLTVITFFILFFIVNYFNFRSKRKILGKSFLFVFTLLLFLPFWYLFQYVVYYSLAYLIPENQIVNCIYLDEQNCLKRSDCSVVYPDGGRLVDGEVVASNPMCVNKGKTF